MNKHATYLSIFFFSTLLIVPQFAQAHCDTLDGPVIQDARIALNQQDVTPVLKWVHQQDETEIRTAFGKTLAVRMKGDAARELADTYFFETLVRVHRAGEGAPYTGLKPAGEITHIEAAADEAMESGSTDLIVTHLTQAMSKGIRDRHEDAMAAKAKASSSVEAGREYVHEYVDFVHYVAGLFDPITKGSSHNHGR